MVTTGNGATPLSFYEQDSEASLAKALSYDEATWGVAARAALEVSLKLASSTDWLRDATLRPGASPRAQPWRSRSSSLPRRTGCATRRSDLGRRRARSLGGLAQARFLDGLAARRDAPTWGVAARAALEVSLKLASSTD